MVVTDDYGADKTNWIPFINKTRARVTYSSGNRANENNEVVFNYEVIFTVRIYHQIKEQMRIIWKNRKYRILSIEENTEQQQLTIKTELINE
ncbi:MAG: head-tail adaptor protein [Roseburia sp.]|nr:head-tail adaptor protein [Roseburia sp.]